MSYVFTVDNMVQLLNSIKKHIIATTSKNLIVTYIDITICEHFYKNIYKIMLQYSITFYMIMCY